MFAELLEENIDDLASQGVCVCVSVHLADFGAVASYSMPQDSHILWASASLQVGSWQGGRGMSHSRQGKERELHAFECAGTKMGKLTWPVLGGDPAACAHRA